MNKNQKIKISSLNILGKNMNQNNVNIPGQDMVTSVVTKKRGRPSKPPTASQLLKIEDKNKRDEYKQKILKLANQLYKDDKITKALPISRGRHCRGFGTCGWKGVGTPQTPKASSRRCLAGTGPRFTR